ncbi:N-acetylmuramoyl-L-alanine amidase [Actinomadura sp. NBRC 104412]|uniref:N-acetylmuramoyl-L-alanine amidase n=1 Tax=Actinomadura sp. NBRC 104412 TaxID=3032203 RepID=UPI002552D6F4|nr:N-acetylmuramoyl-L-alanine amidase [Actinomadura sp. NBRC 104412]
MRISPNYTRGRSAGHRRTPTVHDRPVSWYRLLPARAAAQVTTLVLHATETPDLETAWELAEHGPRVCGHLYLDRDGSVHRFVPLDRVASHVRGHNTPSIGVELVNTGRHPDHFDTRSQTPDEDFPADQIEALKNLFPALRAEFPRLRTLLRHSDLDLETVPSTDDPSRRVRRRIDPGPRFPWDEVKAFWDQISDASTCGSSPTFGRSGRSGGSPPMR